MSLPSVNVHNPLKIRSLNANKPIAYSTLRRVKANDSNENTLRDDNDSEPK